MTNSISVKQSSKKFSQNMSYFVTKTKDLWWTNKWMNEWITKANKPENENKLNKQKKRERNESNIFFSIKNLKFFLDMRLKPSNFQNTAAPYFILSPRVFTNFRKEYSSITEIHSLPYFIYVQFIKFFIHPVISVLDTALMSETLASWA
jgi:glutaredoxin-related protein